MSSMTRVLKLRLPDRVAEVAVQLGPVAFDDGTWTCPFCIGWPGAPKTGEASGTDSVQALYHAMQLVAVQLYMSEGHRSGNLFWDKPGNGYGYPLPIGGRDMAVGADRKL